MSHKSPNPIVAQITSKLSLGTVLAIAFVLQIFATVGLVGYFSFRNGQKAVNDLANRLMDEVGNRVEQNLQNYLITPHQINQTNLNAVKLGLLNMQDLPAWEKYLWQQVQLYPSMLFIGVGNEQGKYRGGEKLENGSLKINVVDNFTGFNFFSYNTNSQGDRTTIFLSKKFNLTNANWYKDVAKVGKQTWTTVHVSLIEPTLLISAIQPVYSPTGEQFQGGLISTLRLNSIGEFLNSLKIGKTGQAFIIERNGNLLATSTSELPFRIKGNLKQQFKAAESRNHLTRSTVQYLATRFSKFSQIQTQAQLNFKINGERQFIKVLPFQDGKGLDWLIAVVVPEADFMEQININTRTTIFLCAGALALSILLAISTAHWIGKPMLRLSQASQNIASGELDQQVEVRGTQELTVLAQSFNQMARQLRESFAALEKTNAELETRVEQRTAELKESQAQLQQQAQDLEERVRQRTAELLEAKEAAEAADEAKSTFLATMSHELRTPLNAILGFAQLMKCDSLLSPSYRENLNIISRSGEHLLALINDILDMSKIESGRMLLMENAFDFYQLLDSVEQMFQLQATEKGLKLQFERSPEVPQHVNTDERKLRQILINLLGNALKFTQRGGVTVRVLMANGSWLIGKEKDNSNYQLPNTHYQLHFEIEDTGCGIPVEEMEDLFEPFVQSKTNRGFQEGTGLGLPISRAFVRLMGGDLTLVRSAVGEGTTFAFDIQVTLAAAAEVEVTVPLRRVIGLAAAQPTYRLLVVEDGWENRQLLIKLLQPLGFEVKEAVNGLKALEVLQSWKPHLIWMDLRMPVMDGYEATQQIRAKLEGEAMAIIALTAHVFKEERAAILSAGFDDCVSKPFREAELFAAMSQHLGVRYIYEEPTTSEASKEENVLSGEDFASLPAEWLKKLEEAILMGDMKLMEDAIAQIRTQDDAIALAIAHCLDNFEYDKILQLIEAANQLLTTNP
ncbi:ATP-binding protein [Microseira sp. BLCC-F43]|jgi:signal transduction histidine kinase/CheY-like chemotaxis protein|uniref:hybrid sensor histidine kinase/response regulator n=1 Tax=Microseira sp. BLCC-F43 TaxID=3153602 RepID=UPI0035B7218D